MSTCQLRLAQLYNMTSLMDSSSSSKNPLKKPSSRSSGLGELASPISLGRPPSASEIAPLSADAATATSAAGHADSGDPGPELAKKAVVVIGAGISGLRAAAVLKRHGVDVVVLEGRDRIGGRIHTVWTDKGPRDIGAAWMHETSQNRLVSLIPMLGIDYYYDDGLALYYTEQGRAGAQFKAKKVADEFADYLAHYYHTNPHAPDLDVSTAVNKFVNDHLLITKDERDWAPQAVKEVELWIGTSCDVASSKHLSYFITERNLYMKGGYESIVNWTAQDLLHHPGLIRLNHVVENIHWSETGASPNIVQCRNDRGESCSFRADAVVCTLPLGVLSHQLVSFHPPLPADIHAGISGMSFGALGKIFFSFDEVFWSKDNDQFIYYPSPTGTTADDDDDIYGSSLGSSSSGGIDNILNYATVTINLWIMNGCKDLCVQIAEPLTQRVEAMRDEKEIYKFFEPLFKLLRTEPYKALPRLAGMESTHWTQDSFAGFGTYSSDKVGDEPELLVDALHAHSGSRLQFAGEHCTRVASGCVHGAFATGETAASNLLRTFGIKQEDGDLVSLV